MGAFGKIIRGNVNISQAIAAEIEEWALFLFGSIPGIAGFFLRYAIYKLLFKRIASMPCIRTGVRFAFMRNIRLGHGVGINANTYVYGRGGITFGDNVLVGPGCAIVAGEHDFIADAPISQVRSAPKPVVLESDCWIGANAVILPGVTIGCGAVIGAGAVVTKNAEPYGIYAGVPARRIGQRRQTES